MTLNIDISPAWCFLMLFEHVFAPIADKPKCRSTYINPQRNVRCRCYLTGPWVFIGLVLTDIIVGSFWRG